MAKQDINVGTTANDGTGDQLRDAFIATNANIAEIYGTGDEITDIISIADMNAGTGTVVRTTVPAAAFGVSTDVAGMIAADVDFVYVCHTTYADAAVPGTTAIWSRVAVATWA